MTEKEKEEIKIKVLKVFADLLANKETLTPTGVFILIKKSAKKHELPGLANIIDQMLN